MSRRGAILEGAAAAARLHDELDIRHAVETTGGSIDVFGALLALKVALVFRPLNGVLGLCIRGAERAGVVISSQCPLHIQRYTGAHELGHVYLGHAASLDGHEILTCAGLQSELEIAASSFAQAFLLPKWLLRFHARRQGWSRSSVGDPHVVYQMALRVGASYEATRIALSKHRIIDDVIASRLGDTSTQDIKAELLATLTREDASPDVWLLTQRDADSVLEGNPDDLFILRLAEDSRAGYLWDTAHLEESGFAILRDQQETVADAGDGGTCATRALLARSLDPERRSLELELKNSRHGCRAPLASFRVVLDMLGREAGMPRAARRDLAIV